MVQNRQGEVKNSIGNVEAKELIRTPHGHELRRGECWWEGGCRAERNKGEKKEWNNYNSIIDKIYLKKTTVDKKGATY